MLFFRREARYVVDSSCLIDGRVLQLFEKGFLEGKAIVPQYARTIAKKTIGHEAEMLLAALKKYASVEVLETSLSGLSEEQAVLKLAVRRKASVVTASEELTRQASGFPRVKIVDIRELYRALIPIFKPNRIIAVRLVKKGLNQGEGVGYVDGVKVVVEDGARLVNHLINVRVTGMLSFESGHLVFGVPITSTVENAGVIATGMDRTKGSDNGGS